MCDLNFDEVKMNTKLGEDFLKSYQSFSPLGFEAANDFVLDSYNNKIFLRNTDKIKQLNIPKTVSPNQKEKKYLFTKLAQKVKDNEKLFSQLEYLIRKIPTQHVINNDLKLIIQNILYCSGCHDFDVLSNNDRKDIEAVVTITDDSPLAVLGHIFQALRTFVSITIYSTKQTAVVSWLFAKLCRDVGLEENVNWTLIKYEDIQGNQLHHMTEFQNGCCGVVSGISDVDSAIDTFLGTAGQLPWTLKRILVQECILKRFQKALEGKSYSSGDIDTDVKSKCSAVYSYGEKLYIFEYVGDDQISNAVVIEAYRTVKELLALLKTYRPFCLSLWSSDVSESNEIAANVDSNIIWINDYGCFDGPAQTSQSFFSTLDQARCLKMTKGNYVSDVDNLKKSREAWLKLDITERTLRILEVVKNTRYDFKRTLPTEHFNLKSFYNVGKGFVCYGHQILPNYVCRFNGSMMHFIFLIQGCMFKGTKETEAGLLQKTGAPILCIEHLDDCIDEPVYKTKTIWASYGTVFSN